MIRSALPAARLLTADEANALAARAAAGDRRAEAALIDAFRPWVWKAALNLTAGRTRRPAPWHVQRAEDLAQAGLLGLLRAARRFDPLRGVKFRTYAFKCVRGCMLNWLTAEARGTTEETPVETLHDHRERGVAAADDRDEAETLLAVLTAQERAVVEGVALRLLQRVEVGRRLGVSGTRVSQVYSQALRKLQAAVV